MPRSDVGGVSHATEIDTAEGSGSVRQHNYQACGNAGLKPILKRRVDTDSTASPPVSSMFFWHQ